MLMTREKIERRMHHLRREIGEHMSGIEHDTILVELFDARKVHGNMYELTEEGEFHSFREAVLYMLSEVQAAVHTAKSNYIDDRIEDEE